MHDNYNNMFIKMTPTVYTDEIVAQKDGQRMFAKVFSKQKTTFKLAGN